MARFSAPVSIARNTIANALRDRILYGVLVFAIGLILLSSVLSNLSLGYGIRIATDLSLTAISFAGTAIAVLLGISAVAREVEQRTALPVFAKPVSRTTWIFGKYLGIVCTAAINVGLMAICATLIIAQFRGQGGAEYSWSAFAATLLLAFLRIAVVAAIAVAFSTFTSATVAFIATTGITVAGYLTQELRYFLQLSDSSMMRLLGDGLYFLVPDLSSIDTLGRLLYARPLAVPDVLFPAGYACVYALVLLLLAAFAFEKRDLS